MKYWFKGNGRQWHEVTEAGYRDSLRCLDHWLERDGALPVWLEGCELLELPDDRRPPFAPARETLSLASVRCEVCGTGMVDSYECDCGLEEWRT